MDLYPLSSVLRNDMHCNLQKQCLYSGSDMLLLLHSKVNTRTTKAGGVSEFLLGREVVNWNSSKWRVNKEIPCCHTHTRPPSYTIQEVFQFVTPSPEMSNAFPFSLILLDSYPPKKYIKKMEKLFTERKPPKKSKGGNVEIKKLCRTLFKCN